MKQTGHISSIAVPVVDIQRTLFLYSPSLAANLTEKMEL